MMKWQLPIIAAVILNVLVLYPPPASAVSASNYKDIFVEHLELGPASYLKLNAHGKSADDIDKALTEIYYGNGLQPFWIEEGRPGSRAADILAVLEDADSHGLDPSSYFVDKIHQYWESSEVTGLVRLDILLSLGMMRYVADQREGRIAPREIDPKLFDTARDAEIDWETLRPEAFGTPDMKAFLSQQAQWYPPEQVPR